VLGWELHDGHIANIAAPPGSVSDYYPDDVGARLWFVVGDIDAAVAKVRELGGTATDPTQSESGWSSDCTDDQGTVFCLSVPSAAYSL
jgi:predicted enzyme related to lactoylglutathione lyase